MAYSEDQISDALAVLTANDGNVARTRRELETSGWDPVPARSTLTKWRAREQHPITERDEEVSEKAHQKKVELADLYERLVRKCLDSATERMEEAEFKDLMRAAGIGTDKLLLLRKEATSISEQRGSGRGDVDLYQQINQHAIDFRSRLEEKYEPKEQTDR